MVFITFTLAMVAFIAHIGMNTIRDQSFFQYWNSHFKKAHPTAQCIKYSESETDQMNLLKYYTCVIYIISDSNIMLTLKSTCLWRHTHRRTFINIIQPILIPWRFYSKEDCLILLYKSKPFLISLPFHINVSNWSYKILIMMLWTLKLYPEVNKLWVTQKSQMPAGCLE